MSEPLTLQTLLDASLDARSLGVAANGDENTTVTTRLGETYPSAKKAIKQMFEAGGLPAKPFATKALLESSALVDGDYAMVTDDSVSSDNGLYQKIAGTWVKSKYDPLNESIKRIDSLTENVSKTLEQKTANIITDKGKALHQFTDADFNIVAEIDANAGLHLFGIDGTVQDAIKKGGGGGASKLIPTTGDLTHAFTDDDENIVGGFDKNGGFRIADLSVSIQEYLDVRKEPTPLRNYTNKDLFTDASNKYFLNMAVSNVKNAPVPFGMLPQRYTMPDAVVSELSLQDAVDYIPLDTPYGKNDKVVHPYVIEFKSLFRGFRYLMCITPYTMESNENPTIFGSKDMAEWELLTGFVQPLSSPQPDTYHSDNGFCYDPINGMLVCYFRESPIGGGYDSTLYYRASRDGIDWTDKTIMISPNATSGYFSPSVLFNPIDGLWHLWMGKEEGQINHYTAKHLNDDWTLIGLCTGLFDWWHGEMKWVGDKYVTLGNKRDPNSNLYFATSIDGNTWVRGKMLWNTAQDAIYKGSFLPRFNDSGQIAFDVFYTTNHASNPAWYRKFFHLTTNFSTSKIVEG